MTRTRDGVLGFLTVVEHTAHGFFGGLLLLDCRGRPLEFHCTAPIQPNRAQQILYGKTLRPWLVGEQIGRALLEKAKSRAAAVLSDDADCLLARELVELPLAWVRLTAAEDGGGLRLETGLGKSGDLAAVQERLAALPEDFDWLEPFQRIREAIDEAQPARKSA